MESKRKRSFADAVKYSYSDRARTNSRLTRNQHCRSALGHVSAKGGHDEKTQALTKEKLRRPKTSSSAEAEALRLQLVERTVCAAADARDKAAAKKATEIRIKIRNQLEMFKMNELRKRRLAAVNPDDIWGRRAIQMPGVRKTQSSPHPTTSTKENVWATSSNSGKKKQNKGMARSVSVCKGQYGKGENWRMIRSHSQMSGRGTYCSSAPSEMIRAKRVVRDKEKAKNHGKLRGKNKEDLHKELNEMIIKKVDGKANKTVPPWYGEVQGGMERGAFMASKERQRVHDIAAKARQLSQKIKTPTQYSEVKHRLGYKSMEPSYGGPELQLRSSEILNYIPEEEPDQGIPVDIMDKYLKAAMERVKRIRTKRGLGVKKERDEQKEDHRLEKHIEVNQPKKLECRNDYDEDYDADVDEETLTESEKISESTEDKKPEEIEEMHGDGKQSLQPAEIRDEGTSPDDDNDDENDEVKFMSNHQCASFLHQIFEVKHGCDPRHSLRLTKEDLRKLCDDMGRATGNMLDDYSEKDIQLMQHYMASVHPNGTISASPSFCFFNEDGNANQSDSSEDCRFQTKVFTTYTPQPGQQNSQIFYNSYDGHTETPIPEAGKVPTLKDFVMKKLMEYQEPDVLEHIYKHLVNTTYSYVEYKRHPDNYDVPVFRISTVMSVAEMKLARIQRWEAQTRELELRKAQKKQSVVDQVLKETTRCDNGPMRRTSGLLTDQPKLSTILELEEIINGDEEIDL